MEHLLQSKRAAFTLTELLIVIAIVSILAALLLAVFSRVRENGRRTACQSNLRQIALAVHQYAQDNSGYYPYWFNQDDGPNVSVLPSGSPPSTNPGIPWGQVLQPYMGNTQILQCPSEPRPASPFPLEDGYTDYAYNLNLSGQNEAKFSTPSLTVLHGDYASAAGWSYTRAPGGLNPVQDGSTQHFGSANYSFADGHVKWLRASQIDPNFVTCAISNGSNFTFCY